MMALQVFISPGGILIIAAVFCAGAAFGMALCKQN